MKESEQKRFQNKVEKYFCDQSGEIPDVLTLNDALWPHGGEFALLSLFWTPEESNK